MGVNVASLPLALQFHIWFLSDFLTELFLPWIQRRRASVIRRLVANEEDKVWNAAVWQGDGVIAGLLEQFEEKHYFNIAQSRSEGYIQSDIAIAVDKYCNVEGKSFVYTLRNISVPSFESHMKNTRDQIANTSRQPTKEERRQLKFCGDNTVSILWICIYRNHESDVDYLSRNTNIDLRTRNGYNQETVLHQAVFQKNQQLVQSILETNSSVSPLGCLELGDCRSETPLHALVRHYSDRTRQQQPEETGRILEIAKLLLEHGANANALNDSFVTPLHLLFGSEKKDSVDVIPLLTELLSKDAEVNSKDITGCSPLHLACKVQDRQAVLLLVEEGADLEALDNYGRTPRAYLTTSDDDTDFHRDLEVLARKSFSKRGKRVKLPQKDRKITDGQMKICQRSPVYCRFQRNMKVVDKNKDVILNWVGTDQKVSDVLYSNNGRPVATFLEQCGAKAENIWKVVQSQLKTVPISRLEEAYEYAESDDKTWRWVNFPANNMTWIKDFIMGHSDNLSSDDTKTAIWEFFQENIKVRDAKENNSRIRAPHAKMRNHGPKLRLTDSIDMPQTEPMVSIVIPFLDIETTHDLERKDLGEEAYFPFTGIDGFQVPQTLDQTFNSSERLSGLRSKENQVIYRWREKQVSRRRSQLSETLRRHWGSSPPGIRERWLSWRSRRRHTEPDLGTAALAHPGQVVTGEESGNMTKMQGIQQEKRPKWLMVRQLWLWKLHDGTILTAIPSREGKCMADDLLETIRHSELDEMSTSDDLLKHIVQQTVTFTERFRMAGLGEHILDIFENELASEIDQEAGFFNSFTRKDWNSKYANKAINEAAGCTWRVKDIRGELRLIDKVFTQQLDVLKEFAAIVATSKGTGPEGIKEEEAALIQDSGLEALRERIRRMDEDAAATIDGLSNITQAMLAQASLKEAESARLMNFIILPFTVVTVIFTPLSFMTSLFAVNSDGFPHNDEGELRLPSDWLRNKMIIGEIGTLIPLLIIVVSISYLRSGTRRTPKEQPK